MKRELLEYIIRECVREVLNETLTTDDQTIGAPAPPAGGQGTAEQPAIPQPEVSTMVGKRGLWFVNPKSPATPVQVSVSSPRNPGVLERELYRIASKVVGPQIKVSSSTLREVPKVLSIPNAVLFLYVGKQNLEDEDIFLLPAKTYQQAKDASVDPSVSSDYPPTSNIEPSTEPTAMAAAMQAGGKVTAPNIDENVIRYRNLISFMVKESLRECKKRK